MPTMDEARQTKLTGYNLIRSTGEMPCNVPGIRHAPVLPEKATYSPWLADERFQSTFAQVVANTLVDRLRAYEIWSLVQQSAKLTGGALIEVGVWRGGTGCLIAKAARFAGLQNLVYLCDTFEGVVNAGAKDPIYRGGEHNDTSAQLVVDLAQKMQLENVRIVPGIFPSTASQIPETAIRFAHMDVDVYQSTAESLEWIWPRLVPGGIVVFDDYGTHGTEGVTLYVNEFANHPDRLFLHNVNGHAIFIKLA